MNMQTDDAFTMHLLIDSFSSPIRVNTLIPRRFLRISK